MKLKLLRERLCGWNREVFGNVELRKESLLNEIILIDAKEEVEGLSKEEMMRQVSLKGDYERFLLMEEVMWCQKARIHSLKEGDRNTKFFRKMASCCKSSKGINRLRMGEEREDRPEVISSHMVHYFRHLFSED